MLQDWKRRFTWIDSQELKTAFLKNPYPARGHRGNLAPLSASIARVGIINPIIARVHEGKLQVICGYRRWLAAQVSGTERIPVLVTNLSDPEAERLFIEEESWSRSAAAAAAAPETETDQQPSAALLEADLEGIGGLIDEIYRETAGMFAGIRAEKKIPIAEVERLMTRLQSIGPVRRGFDIREAGGTSGNLAVADDPIPGWVAAHSLRVAIAALHFGESLEWSRDTILQLGISAMLHDLGMLFVPVKWCSSRLPLTRAQQEALRAHVITGAELIERTGRWPDFTALAARDHHERWDGTGYPAGKRGREVGLMARIIGLLDTYAALVSERAHRPAYLLGEAVRRIQESAALGLFEPALERQFRLVFTPRPVGAWGRLPDGAIVRVEEVLFHKARSHRLRVHSAGSRCLAGEELWFREADLAAQAEEISPRLRARLEASRSAEAAGGETAGNRLAEAVH